MLNKLASRIIIPFKLFWFGLCKPSVLNEQIFIAMAQLLEIAFKATNDDRPYTTHLMLANKRIVSFWIYPGLSKNPVDRITELLKENDALKNEMSNFKPVPTNEPFAATIPTSASENA